MKLLVFAHTPPPTHGQSLMVQLMIEGFGGDARQATPPDPPPRFGIECYHVNARLSQGFDDIGSMRPGKVWRVLALAAQAVTLRLRYGIRVLYYVPSPPKRASLYRDWLVLGLCRPWFGRLVLHWHAVGLGEWLEHEAQPWERALSRWLLGRADLSLAVSEFSRADAERLSPRRTSVVLNGLPDPCPDYEQSVAPRRTARADLRRRLFAAEAGSAVPASPNGLAGPDPATARVLYMTHCRREKGLFDAIEGVRLARETLARRGTPLNLVLRVAGDFPSETDRQEFARCQAEAGDWLQSLGFLDTPAKQQEQAQADLFLFPSYYPTESLSVAVLEAMAYGLPVVATRWRATPEALPAGYDGLVDPRQPDQIAAALLKLLGDDGRSVRLEYCRRFTIEPHWQSLAAALRTLG
ncbi:MAG TPA: glycosyltransferase family 4 protein [Verrucomicrobiota bacterium]|nr:glycosyltransferase family 4 protein [Verrucomicrobiota bacterium]HNU52027.1 glycosyltransferase family 4 protein [Verrucomicrobiota bacterium]